MAPDEVRYFMSQGHPQHRAARRILSARKCRAREWRSPAYAHRQ